MTVRKGYERLTISLPATALKRVDREVTRQKELKAADFRGAELPEPSRSTIVVKALEVAGVGSSKSVIDLDTPTPQADLSESIVRNVGELVLDIADLCNLPAADFSVVQSGNEMPEDMAEAVLTILEQLIGNELMTTRRSLTPEEEKEATALHDRQGRLERVLSAAARGHSILVDAGIMQDDEFPWARYDKVLKAFH